METLVAEVKALRPDVIGLQEAREVPGGRRQAEPFARAMVELYGEAGYDFTWIDMEHGPFDLPAALGHIMAARGTNLAPFVRVLSNVPASPA